MVNPLRWGQLKFSHLLNVGVFPSKPHQKKAHEETSKMLYVSSSYVASTLRTTVINTSFSVTQTALQGGRAQVAGLTSRRRTASRYNSARKRHENELRSRQKAHHSKAHQKLRKRMVWAYGFMSVFCLFQGRTSPTTRGSRGVR